MARNMTAAMSSALQDAANKQVIFIELGFPSGTVRISTFDRDLIVAGNTFKGGGELVSLSPIEETTDIRAAGVAVTLSGAVAALVTALFEDAYQGRAARLWLGLIDGAGALIASPIEMGPYRMDAAEFIDDPQRPLAVIHLESRLRDLLTPRERRWSNEDQKAAFSSDTSLRYVETLSDATMRMGSV